MSKLRWHEVGPGKHEAEGCGGLTYVAKYEPGEFDPVHGSVWVLNIWYGANCARRAWVDPTLEGIQAHCEKLEENELIKRQGTPQTAKGPVLNHQSGTPHVTATVPPCPQSADQGRILALTSSGNFHANDRERV